MTRQEKNEEIAKILGFKQYGITVNEVPNKEKAWDCPAEYIYLRTSPLMYSSPDFIGLLEKQRQVEIIVMGYENY